MGAANCGDCDKSRLLLHFSFFEVTKRQRVVSFNFAKRLTYLEKIVRTLALGRFFAESSVDEQFDVALLVSSAWHGSYSSNVMVLCLLLRAFGEKWMHATPYLTVVSMLVGYVYAPSSLTATPDFVIHSLCSQIASSCPKPTLIN